DQTRVNFNQMLDEIRCGQNVQIGTGNYMNFTPIASGLQQGDTIQIISTTNLNCLIYYYFVTNAPTNNSWLVRAMLTNNAPTATNYILVSMTTMAQSLTNMTVSNVVTSALITNAM